MNRRVPSRPDDRLRRGAGSREDGSTLIEALIALVIASGAIFVLVGGMSALFTDSFQNRQSTTSGVVARDYAEALETVVAQASAAGTAGAWCSTTYTVPSTPPAGYTVVAAYGTCPTNSVSTPQFQTVVITATSPSSATEQLRMVVRKT